MTVVEFFDYRCPYCRSMQPILADLLRRHPNLRLGLREWPVFGGISVYAAKIALASNWQGHFPAVHAGLFALGSSMDEPAIDRVAADAGVDMVRLDRDMASRSRDLQTMLIDTDDMAHSLGFEGTPGFVAGHFKAPGALSLSQMEDMLHEASKGMP